MAYTVQTEFTPEEIASFEKLRKEGKVNVVLGEKPDPTKEVDAQAYPATVICTWGHVFTLFIPCPGLYYAVCPYCGWAGWVNLY